MKNKILLFTVLCLSVNLFSQNLNDSWQVGIGMGITKFSTSDAAFIGDAYQFQVPVLSLTMPVGERLSIDGAMSVNTIDDIGLINNSASYFSIDGSVRYNFNAVMEKFSPYAFIGASVVDSKKKMTPTFNIGAGGIYWITDKIGINPQIYYKHSLSSFDSMRSHIQGTLGLVFKLNWNNISKGTQGVSISGVGCM
ncbi:outer membrane beta-barrel protein [Tenacibaculum insulae]|uniref:outer membrane beta-barrel protein n=1 Tax=Tenacibaculum insulae TaxID=2029677 RepID=UPI003AB7CFE2